MRGQRCRCRRAHVDAAGAPQVGHFRDPDVRNPASRALSGQGVRYRGICIPGEKHPAYAAAIKRFAKLLGSDQNSMVTKILQAVVARRSPFNQSIHTNQYYTLFTEKVKVFLSQNPLFF